ncbi:hypothetical protein CCHOA_07590 [Corynebacterium choanae]|uniref:Uncharacterized protein n=1 Tax=Corynebacterium choanae TaxID=1862358 RepID=A0A3G6JBA0_9CORY|nr:hypothetical protein CCHOA_07590 [Corynebacterium choanae]
MAPLGRYQKRFTALTGTPVFIQAMHPVRNPLVIRHNNDRTFSTTSPAGEAHDLQDSNPVSRSSADFNLQGDGLFRDKQCGNRR